MLFILCVSVLLLSIHHGQCAIQATANVRLDNTSTLIGTLQFVQNDANSPVVITGTLNQLNASSSHGFHVHTLPVSDTSPNCTAAAAHFNPYNTDHGSITNDIRHRHVGDLGNITTNANGSVTINISDSIIQFYNATQSIANRTIVVHLMFDDGGNTGIGLSNTTGNAGYRVACGLIKIASSNGLNINPTMSALFLTIIITFIMFFY